MIHTINKETNKVSQPYEILLQTMIEKGLVTKSEKGFSPESFTEIYTNFYGNFEYFKAKEYDYTFYFLVSKEMEIVANRIIPLLGIKYEIINNDFFGKGILILTPKMRNFPVFFKD